MALSVKNMLGGSGGGASPFAWGKYEQGVIWNENEIKSVSDIYLSRVSSGSLAKTFLYSTSYRINDDGLFELINPQTFSYRNASSGTAPISTTDTTYVIVNKIGGVIYDEGDNTLSVGEKLIKIPANYRFNNEGTYIYFSYSVMNYYVTEPSISRDFLEYVTDKNPLKYPNGEIADDGFFYRYANEGLFAWAKSVVSSYKMSTSSTSEWNYEITDNNESIPCYSTCTLVGNNLVLGGTSGTTSISNLDSYTTYRGYYIKLPSGIVMKTVQGSRTKVAIEGYVVSIVPDVFTLIDTVVSDNENAYPDKAVQDGYYYEAIANGIALEMFGCTKYEVYEFAKSSNTLGGNYAIPHTLGEIPKFVSIYAENVPSSPVTGFIYCVASYNIGKASGVKALCGFNSYGTLSYNGNETMYHYNNQVIFSASGLYYQAGVNYKVVIAV